MGQTTKQFFRLINDEVRDNCVKTIFLSHEQSDKPLCVTIADKDETRSSAQNRLYWKWLTQWGNTVGYTKDEAHYEFKRRFLIRIYYRDDKDYAQMCDAIKALESIDMRHYTAISTEVIKMTSTTKATTEQMAEYLNDIYRFCYEQGVLLQVSADLRWVTND